jgi:hypothetical protein
VGSFCEHSNNVLGSIKADEILNELREYSLPEKDSSLWSYLRRLNKILSVDDTGIRIEQQDV